MSSCFSKFNSFGVDKIGFQPHKNFSALFFRRDFNASGLVFQEFDRQLKADILKRFGLLAQDKSGGLSECFYAHNSGNKRRAVYGMVQKIGIIRYIKFLGSLNAGGGFFGGLRQWRYSRRDGIRRSPPLKDDRD